MSSVKLFRYGCCLDGKSGGGGWLRFNIIGISLCIKKFLLKRIVGANDECKVLWGGVCGLFGKDDQGQNSLRECVYIHTVNL